MTTSQPETAVVTGASAGVGRATATALARRGMAVALLARGAAGLEGTAGDVRAAGGRPLVVPTDVANWHDVEAAAATTEKELGPIDLWVNNAMTTVFALSWDIAPEELRRATEVTYLGQVHGTMAALRYMRPRDQGTVVNVGSALAYRAIPLQSTYCAAKFACRGFTEAVRAELLAEGSAVAVSMVHLPAVNTPQFRWCLNRLPKHPQPVPPVYAPEVAAQAIVQTALRPRRQKVFGVFNTFMVLASKVAPGVLDHYLARTGQASQQADIDADPDRPTSLWEPADDAPGTDQGARGVFWELEGGASRPGWLAGLPSQLLDIALAARDRLREVAALGSERGRERRRGQGDQTSRIGKGAAG